LFKDQIVFGPIRVFPGRLSVSRAFGDIEAKKQKYGGNQYVLTAQPDVKCFKIEDSYDFILLGCDGIFDKLSDF
jgi:serine/threonine protein phosphatase PrpC